MVGRHIRVNISTGTGYWYRTRSEHAIVETFGAQLHPVRSRLHGFEFIPVPSSP